MSTAAKLSANIKHISVRTSHLAKICLEASFSKGETDQ